MENLKQSQVTTFRDARQAEGNMYPGFLPQGYVTKIIRKIKNQQDSNSKANKQIKQQRQKEHVKQKIQQSDRHRYIKQYQSIVKPIELSQRTEKIQQELKQNKLRLFEIFRVYQRKLAAKMMFRKEVLAEIFDFVGQTNIQQQKDTLHIKEEENRSSLFLMNKHDSENNYTWNYVLIKTDKKLIFQSDITNGSIKDLKYYGSIVQSGKGAQPPKAVIKDIKKQFLMYEHEPGYAIKKKASEYFGNNDYSKCIKELSSYLKDYNPTNRISLLNRGLSYMRLGKMQRAVDDFNKCNSIYPFNYQGHINAAWGYIQLGKYKQSIKILKKSRKLSPYDPTLYIYLAVAHQKLGYLSNAKDYALQALKIRENDVFASRILSEIEFQQQQKEGMELEL